MSKKKFDPLYDDISAEDIYRYFKAKKVIKDNEFINCPLCQNHSFSFTDSAPFFPSVMGNKEIKYRLALQPKLVKPAPMYALEYAQRNLDGKSEEPSPPIDMILKQPELLEFFEHNNSREYLVLTCNHCGHTLLIERDKIVEFLDTEQVAEEK